jgi:outer membrane biosynthesis protein TonB
VINGILYCPYSTNPFIPDNQNRSAEPSSSVFITPPPPVFKTPLRQAEPTPPEPKLESNPKAKSQPKAPEPEPSPKAKPKPQKQSPPPPVVNMQGPAFGALGASFTVVRAMQGICLISIIGMTANFIAEMVASNQSPPHVLVGTLSVVRCPSSLFFPPKQN